MLMMRAKWRRACCREFIDVIKESADRIIVKGTKIERDDPKEWMEGSTVSGPGRTDG